MLDEKKEWKRKRRRGYHWVWGARALIGELGQAGNGIGKKIDRLERSSRSLMKKKAGMQGRNTQGSDGKQDRQKKDSRGSK